MCFLLRPLTIEAKAYECHVFDTHGGQIASSLGAMRRLSCL